MLWINCVLSRIIFLDQFNQENLQVLIKVYRIRAHFHRNPFYEACRPSKG
jgi:hypothetical protein